MIAKNNLIVSGGVCDNYKYILYYNYSMHNEMVPMVSVVQRQHCDTPLLGHVRVLLRFSRTLGIVFRGRMLRGYAFRFLVSMSAKVGHNTCQYQGCYGHVWHVCILHCFNSFKSSLGAKELAIFFHRRYTH